MQRRKIRLVPGSSLTPAVAGTVVFVTGRAGPFHAEEPAAAGGPAANAFHVAAATGSMCSLSPPPPLSPSLPASHPPTHHPPLLMPPLASFATCCHLPLCPPAVDTAASFTSGHSPCPPSFPSLLMQLPASHLVAHSSPTTRGPQNDLLQGAPKNCGPALVTWKVQTDRFCHTHFSASPPDSCMHHL